MSDIFSYRDKEIYWHHSIDQFPNPENFPMHAHEHLEVLYFISGNGSYLVEGNRYPLHPQDIFVMRASETHKLIISPDRPYERIAIHFDPSLFDFIDPERTLLRPFLDRPAGQQNRSSADESHSVVLLSRILQFLTSLQNIYNQLNYLPTPAQDLPRLLVTYVNEHLFENISLQTVADAFYRSRSQISRLFRQSTGSSLWEYITLKRLLTARSMLQREETAGTACAACGFSDYFAFYRAYRARFGHSPKEDGTEKSD